ncbi:MAG: crossover junction endodeoxyribonuclease RuvC [Candidatus Levybacteria bacterium]|nr:crossover junction endodeoxyribonuclease RuvC [Candidatus Levybacteria bacterium]
MRILGIDPGIGRMGWGVIEMQSATLRQSLGREFKVQSCGCFETEPNSPTPGRLLKIYRFISKLMDEYKPDALSIEELFFNTNAKTAFVVGQSRGVVLLAAEEHGLQIGIYTPLQVKIAMTGYGRAEKRQVGQMVKTLLRLSVVPKPDDTTDALAIALTHAFSAKILNLKR